LPLKVLPFRLDSFDWDRFESFCLSVVRVLPEVRRAARYGVMGESQKGIDIEAELRDGRKRTIQCRHRSQVTAPEIKTTVNETTYVADEHEIWLTCPVGTKVSDYIAGLDGWTIQSDEGVSQKVRLELPREKARLIVRDAFGAQVARDFLGPGWRGPVGSVRCL
jgi:hypothetical protein